MPKRLRKVDERQKPAANPFLKEFKALRKSIPEWNSMFTSHIDNAARADAWVRIEVLGQSLCKKYSWAVPDDRALRILSQFAPLVEIACGKGYWSSLLRDRGVDIVATDKYTGIDLTAKKKRRKNSKSKPIDFDGSTNWTDVELAGPEILLSERFKERNLFLCYPDESESVGIESINNFSGEYVIHVGEMMTTGGTRSGEPQAPFGRTSSADFQVRLAEKFHCLLIADIPRFPFAKDTISVWKRTQFIEGLAPQLNNDDDDDGDEAESAAAVSSKLDNVVDKKGDDIDGGKEDGNEEGEDEDSNEDVNLWAIIPPDEEMPTTRSAECLKFLLE